MRTETGQKILSFIKERGEVSPKEIQQFAGIGAPALFRQLKKLLTTDQISKIGKPPRVFYCIAKEEIKQIALNLDEKNKNIIEKNYLTFTLQGEMLSGIKGFVYWCTKQGLPLEKTAHEYLETLKKYAFYKKDNLIKGTDKLKSTFPQTHLDELYYLDFYTLERFGKTKLGALTLYAKQNQDKTLIKEIYQETKNKIINLIQKNNIQALAFVPPTVKRTVQLQKELEKLILADTNLPKINLVKAQKTIAIPQKSLNKLEERVENARNTIIVDDQRSFANVLLIDDAVGSGATLNETANKLKNRHVCTGKLVGLAIVGSFKGFPVISEI
jgi:dimeric dUTPase (all-alpha-NTP-PPase superfamily)